MADHKNNENLASEGGSGNQSLLKNAAQDATFQSYLVLEQKEKIYLIFYFLILLLTKPKRSGECYTCT